MTEHGRNERSARLALEPKANAWIPCDHDDTRRETTRFREKGTLFRSSLANNPDRSPHKQSREACPIPVVSLDTVFPTESNRHPCCRVTRPPLSPLWEIVRDDVSFVWEQQSRDNHHWLAPNSSLSSRNATLDSTIEARADAPF